MKEIMEPIARPLYHYRFGSVEFDARGFELRVAGLAVDIQRKPLQVLHYLLEHEGSVVSKDELLERLWAGTLPVDNVVGNAIAKLRAALGEENGKRIVTQPRIGYRLVGPVERRLINQLADSPLQLAAGSRVPRRENFQLESLVARSGTNEVWLARHEHTHEPRIYKFALGSDDLARLKREVTLYRILVENLDDHSAFAAVIDWNLETVPYFLEYEYGGDNLRQWADAGHLASASEARRLAIFASLGDAVAAAHSVGVLHKDIKPANVLIAMEGSHWKVRLTDFGSGGVADADTLSVIRGGVSVSSLSAASATEPGGTQPYVAPEFFRGQAVTAQSDVYALGVMLYQMVSGDFRRALSPGWERDVSDELLREDIAAATDGDPARRIATAQELVNRVRELEERRARRKEQTAAQEQATRNAALVRISRARRPWLIATFAVLCAGLVATLLLYKRVVDAQQAQAHQFAVAQALNDFLTSNFIATANPTITGRKDVTVVEAARNAALSIDRALPDSEPSIRGGLHAAMQSAFAGLSDVPASLAEGRKALEALSIANPADPAQLARVHVGMAALLSQSSKLNEAAGHLQSADALLREAALTDDSIVIRFLWARARLAGFKLDLTAALADYQRAWELAKADPRLSPELRDQLEFSYADALKMAGRFAAAQIVAEQLLERQTARIGADHPQTCYSRVLLASVRGYDVRELSPALESAQQAAGCLNKSLGDGSIRTASAYQVLADLQLQAGRYQDAALAYQRLASTYTTILGPTTLQTINAHMNEGVSQQLAGRFTDADATLSAALDVARVELPWSAPTTESLRYHLADCRLDQRSTKDVEHLLEGLSVETLNASEIETDWEGRLTYQAGRLALFTGQPDKARMALRQAAETITTTGPDGRILKSSIQRLMADIPRNAKDR